MAKSWVPNWHSAMGVPEVEHLTDAATKKHGPRPLDQHAGAPKKRSYKRALNRANKMGCTFYKGQLIFAPKLHPQEVPPPGHPSARRQPKRLSIATWNGAGLNYDHIMRWTLDTEVDIAVFTETKCSWTPTGPFLADT